MSPLIEKAIAIVLESDSTTFKKSMEVVKATLTEAEYNDLLSMSLFDVLKTVSIGDLIRIPED